MDYANCVYRANRAGLTDLWTVRKSRLKPLYNHKFKCKLMEYEFLFLCDFYNLFAIVYLRINVIEAFFAILILQ